MPNTEIEVGRTLDEIGADFVAARNAAEAHAGSQLKDGIVFRDWQALTTTLTPRRYELLRHLSRTPVEGVCALARALGRDVKRVHTDVMTLSELGLLTRSENGALSTEIGSIASIIKIAA